MKDPGFKIEETLGFALHHASYVFKAALRENFRRGGLDATPEEFVFLYLIPKGGETQKTLTERSLKEKTTITRLIDRLVAKGQVRRFENKENRRQQIIQLTKKGEKTKAAMLPIVMKFIGEATVGIDPKDLEKTRKTLNLITRNIIPRID